ncbi:cell division protein ZapE [Pseudomonas sp. NPDC007930]|uniref:cell division protein ZapE n=1 Tax=Pseudomonas sp. NPDC007930 TaxID=3364417 RepID=UPI0036EF8510
MPALPAEGPGQALAEHFEQAAGQRGYTLSAGQRQVVDSLARRVGPLLACAEGSGPTPQSLYLHGKVGRGKSWLLDTFFQAVPLAAKRRVHFHVFFNQLHQGMFSHRAHADALGATLDELLHGCLLLCFDEFHVHDIGDAMLITRLFKALFERGVLLIVTSNYAPEGLLPNPLYHERFLPVIRLIHSDMQVLEVGGEQDYRALSGSGTGQRFVKGAYVWPGDAEQRQALGLAPTGPGQPLAVGHRTLRVQFAEQGRIGFTFSELFEQATAVMDYLILCETYHDWTIDQLPLLDDCPIAVQQRFINLVDVLYDQDKRLTLISAYPLAEALHAKAIDLMRSQSRLGQLQARGPLEQP